MKIIVKLLAVLALLLVTLIPQALVSAEVTQAEGHEAWAYFSSIDASGCIKTSVEIDTAKELLISLALFQYDMCTGEVLLEAYGRKPLSPSEIKFFGNLDSARLTTTVQVTDLERGLSFDIFIDLTWIGTGDILAYHAHDHNQPSPGCNVNVQGREKYREAQASGTLSDGTTNFTPTTSLNAYLYSWKNTFVASHACE
ncbi:MAG TPA: hypothetical protein VK909_11260 [Anaerolineales bacterium]|jgi:hypothetical protein|nr:hypothetical protein [Anaerolineales bacterium]